MNLRQFGGFAENFDGSTVHPMNLSPTLKPALSKRHLPQCRTDSVEYS